MEMIKAKITVENYLWQGRERNEWQRRRTGRSIQLYAECLSLKQRVETQAFIILFPIIFCIIEIHNKVKNSEQKGDTIGPDEGLKTKGNRFDLGFRLENQKNVNAISSGLGCQDEEIVCEKGRCGYSDTQA